MLVHYRFLALYHRFSAMTLDCGRFLFSRLVGTASNFHFANIAMRRKGSDYCAIIVTPLGSVLINIWQLFIEPVTYVECWRMGARCPLFLEVGESNLDIGNKLRPVLSYSRIPTEDRGMAEPCSRRRTRWKATENCSNHTLKLYQRPAMLRGLHAEAFQTSR